METNLIEKLILPNEIIESFNLVDIKESQTIYELYLEEKTSLVPESLLGKAVILDGFCNPLSLLTFPQKGKPTYLIIKRRRWKEKGGSTHYSNEYSFNQPHVKATKEFAAFLKEVHRHTPDEYLRLCGIDGR